MKRLIEQRQSILTWSCGNDIAMCAAKEQPHIRILKMCLINLSTFVYPPVSPKTSLTLKTDGAKALQHLQGEPAAVTQGRLG